MSEAISFKNGTWSHFVLELKTTDINLIESKIKEKIKSLPNFFNYSPVVIVFSAEIDPLDLNFKELKNIFFENKIIFSGVLNPDENLIPFIKENKIGIYTGSSGKINDLTIAESKPKVITKPINTKIIKNHIRSGQSIKTDGDLIVIGNVSMGAELFAGGNISIFGQMRGKAFAGTNGNIESIIAITHNNAEMLGINGVFQIAIDMPPKHRDGSVLLNNKDGVLTFTNI